MEGLIKEGDIEIEDILQGITALIKMNIPGSRDNFRNHNSSAQKDYRRNWLIYQNEYWFDEKKDIIYPWPLVSSFVEQSSLANAKLVNTFN